MSRHKQRDPSAEQGRSPNLLRYAGLGTELAASVIGLTLLGWWIDYRYKTSPVGILVGSGLGVVGGLYNFLRAALRLSRETDKRGQGAQERAEDGPD